MLQRRQGPRQRALNLTAPDGNQRGRVHSTVTVSAVQGLDVALSPLLFRHLSMHSLSLCAVCFLSEWILAQAAKALRQASHRRQSRRR